MEQRCKIAAWMEVLLICDCNAATISGTVQLSLCVRSKHHPQHSHEVHEEWGSVVDRARSGQSEKNIATVREAFNLSQGKSIRRASAELNISATSIQTILKRKPKLFSYKV